MKQPIIDRRQLLRWIAWSSPALLAGCSGGRSGSTAAAVHASSTTDTSSFLNLASDQPFMCDASKSCKPLVEFLTYSANSPKPAATDLGASLYNVSAVPDRLGDGEFCYGFNGTNSLGTVSSIQNFPAENFALSLWLKSTATANSQVVALAYASKLFAAIELNNACGVGVFWTQFNSYLLAVGKAGEFTDGSWHHLLVQFDGSMLSLYVDGIARGSVQAPNLGGEGISAAGTAIAMYLGGGTNLAFQGDIDDVRLHNRTFDATRVPGMVYAWSQYKPVTRNDSLLAYYPFDGSAVNDNGRGFDGIIYNAIPAVDRFGQADRAYAFDGVSAYIELPQQLGPVATDYCLAFWLQSSNPNPMTAFSVTKGVTAGAADVNFVVNSGHALAVILSGATSTQIAYGAPGDLTDGKWHFVLLQRVGSVYQLYVDGSEIGTAQNSAPVLTSDSIVRIGRGSGALTPAANFWTGGLDDVQIYDTAFSDQEILNLMQLQFRPRDGAGLLVFQNKLWLLGGWNPSDPVPTNDQVWSSSDGANWSFIAHAPWEGRHMAGWLVYGDRLWVVGGDNNSGHYQNDVWSSADGINWVEETTSVPWANRATHMTSVFDDKMWLMGGQQLGNDSIPGAAYNDVYSSTDGKTWTLVAPHAGWSPRGLMIGNVVYAGKMWVIGGGTYDVRTFLNDVWSSPDGVHWTQVLAAAPWPGRQFHNVAAFHGKIWVVAGGTGASQGGTSEVWYSNDGANWTQLPDSPWIMRHASSLVPFQNGLWFACGSDVAAYNDVWQLTYAT